MWLVQRGNFDYNLTLDLSKLSIDAGAIITAEMVGPEHYGEVTTVQVLPESRKLRYLLRPQTVVLLTISKAKLKSRVIAGSSFITKKIVERDIGGNNNTISYVHFDLPGKKASTAQQVLLKIRGYTDKSDAPYRIHVYAAEVYNDDLVDDDGFVTDIGTKSFVAGELAFTKTPSDHYLDVTSLVKKLRGKHIRFTLIREVRQLGDDGDRGHSVMHSGDEKERAELILWSRE
jgi:hypothetical protein